MNKTFKVIKVASISTTSYEDAIQNAIMEAHETLRGLNWFQVLEQRGRIDETGKIVEWQVIVEVAFKLEHHKG
ncbi:MAG: dodecin domain-containing protein [Nitrospinae bacterium]|nr:dodecin domain-containing protein [Nitrospinota bacterium]